MSIEFEGENNNSTGNAFRSRTLFGEPTTPKMVNWFVKKGIAKNEKQAGYVLLALCAVCIIAMVYIFAVYVYGFSFTTPKNRRTPAEMKALIQEKIRQTRESRANGI